MIIKTNEEEELEKQTAGIINNLIEDVYRITLVTCECGAIFSHNIGDEKTTCPDCNYTGQAYEFPDLFY